TTSPIATASPCGREYPVTRSIAWATVCPALRTARRPCSCSSSLTIRALMVTLWTTSSPSSGSSPLSNPAALRSIQRKYAASATKRVGERAPGRARLRAFARRHHEGGHFEVVRHQPAHCAIGDDGKAAIGEQLGRAGGELFEQTGFDENRIAPGRVLYADDGLHYQVTSSRPAR